MKTYKPTQFVDKNGITWTVETTYVDTHTGEIIPKRIGTNKLKYIIIKTIKYETRLNNTKTRGTIKYTKECKIQPQGELNFG